jgi:hypothetical protein
MKDIVYSKLARFSFCSEAECFVKLADSFFVITSSNSFVYKVGEADKQVISLPSVFALAKKEVFKSFCLVGKMSFLAVTSKLNVFLFTLNPTSNAIEDVKAIGFKFAQNLKSAANTKFASNGHVTLMACGRFVFYLSQKEEQLKMFKIFNEEIVDIILDPKNLTRVFVLTEKSLTVISAGSVPAIPNARIEHKEAVSGLLSMCIVNSLLAFRNADCQIHIFDPDTRSWTDKIDICNSRNEYIEFEGLNSIDNRILIAYNKFYVFVFSPALDAIKYVLSSKDFDYLACDQFLIDFKRKSENLARVGVLQVERYTKENKLVRYSQLSIEDQLHVLLSYMTKQFLKQEDIPDHKTCIQNMLNSYQLKAQMYKHPKFKSQILRFLAFAKDFSFAAPKNAANKFYVNSLRIVSLKELEKSISEHMSQSIKPEITASPSVSKLFDSGVEEQKTMTPSSPFECPSPDQVSPGLSRELAFGQASKPLSHFSTYQLSTSQSSSQ